MYKEMDSRIIKAIDDKKNPLECKSVIEEATRIADGTGREDFRVIDGRLQVLRKSGKIRFLTKKDSGGERGWRVVAVLR